jgi:hypothetical protein
MLEKFDASKPVFLWDPGSTSRKPPVTFKKSYRNLYWYVCFLGVFSLHPIRGRHWRKSTVTDKGIIIVLVRIFKLG